MNNAIKSYQQIILKTLIICFSVFYAGVCLYALFSYSTDIVTTLARGCDEFHFLDNARIMFDEFMAFRLKGFFYNCYSFGYGIVYWLLLFIATLPGFLLDNQRLIVLAGRFLSLMCSIGTFALVLNMMKREFNFDLAVLVLAAVPSLLSAHLFALQTMVHPDTVYVFFIFLTIFFLQKDHGRYGKNFYIAAFVWILSLSAKMLAGFSAPIWIIYFFYFKPKSTDLAKLFLSGAGFFILVNSMLCFPLIGIRFFKWLVGMGGKAAGPVNMAILKHHFFALNCSFVNLFVLSLAGVFCVLMFKRFNRVTFLSSVFLCVIALYLLLSFYCCNGVSTFHYGLPLLYALPLLVVLFFRGSSQFLGRWALPTHIVFVLLLCSGFSPFRLPGAHLIPDGGAEVLEKTQDMDIAFNLLHERLIQSEQQLIVRGNAGFGLRWPSIKNPPIYLSIFDLEDSSLKEADIIMLRVYSSDEHQDSTLFPLSEVTNNDSLKKFFEEIYDDGRLLIYERITS